MRGCPMVVLLCVGAALGAAGGAWAEPSVVVLVRHAEKAPAPADDPPLSADGEGRAQALAAAVADMRIDAIVATQFVRTQRTAAVVAAERGLKPIVVKAGGDTKSHARAVADAVRARPMGEAVLVVGHSNTVPAIIGALGGPTMPDLCDAEYGNLFILVMTPGSPRLVRAQYGTPDSPMAADCARTMKQGGR